MSVEGHEQLGAEPIETVLGGLRIPPLPTGASAAGLLAFVRSDEPDGSVGWSVRVTAGMHDEEILGLLVGYVEHLKREAANSWQDAGTTG